MTKCGSSRLLAVLVLGLTLANSQTAATWRPSGR
jgi:hypothetical protein